MRRVLFLSFVLSLVVVIPSHATPLWCTNADDIFAEVNESTVTVHHLATLYNCCPSYFDFEVEQQAQLISVSEVEVPGDPCDCNCCYNLAVDIENVAPGEYQIDYTWWDYETGQWQLQVLEVCVPDVGQQGELAVARVAATDCLDVTSVPDTPGEPADEPFTWGTIKARYR